MNPNYLSIAYNCKSSIKRNLKNYKPRKYGAYIVKWHRSHPDLDYSIKHMYVIKKDGNGYKRGQQTFKKPEVPYRDIYFYPEETREALRELLICFDLPAKNQIGFTANRGIHNLMQTEPERTDFTRIKLDLKDAFNSISQEQIFWILRKVFDVNTKLANELSHKWTHKGHMLQGHPLAPAIFNLVTRDLNEWLSQRTGIIQYADDILIYEETNYISWKWLKTIFKKYQELGFKINVEKEGIFHKRKDLQFLGLNFTYEKWRPLVSGKRRQRRKILRKCQHLIKLGKLDDKNPVYLGHLNWYNYDAKQIVLNKIQSQNSRQKHCISGDKIPKFRPKTAQSGIPKKYMWILWANPATIPIKLKEKYFSYIF